MEKKTERKDPFARPVHTARSFRTLRPVRLARSKRQTERDPAHKDPSGRAQTDGPERMYPDERTSQKNQPKTGKDFAKTWRKC